MGCSAPVRTSPAGAECRCIKIFLFTEILSSPIRQEVNQIVFVYATSNTTFLGTVGGGGGGAATDWSICVRAPGRAQASGGWRLASSPAPAGLGDFRGLESPRSFRGVVTVGRQSCALQSVSEELRLPAGGAAISLHSSGRRSFRVFWR